MAKWPEGAILFAAQTTPLWIFHAYDKEQRVERLKKRYVKGTLTKADINKQGYNKFLLEIRYTLMKQRLKRIGLGMVLRATDPILDFALKRCMMLVRTMERRTIFSHFKRDVGSQIDVSILYREGLRSCLYLFHCIKIKSL